MSWRDRPYSGDECRPELRLAFPKPTTAVAWLIIANVVVFVVDTLSQHAAPRFWATTFGLSWSGLFRGFLWQPVTYMFCHVDLWPHLLLNMLGLYIFGVEFERAFGRDRFLRFYAVCGLLGGLGYLILSGVMPDYRAVPLRGASGAVYGLLIAAIIFFPHIQVVVVIFPMPIRVFGLIVLGILLLGLLSPGPMQNLGGEVCHIAGAAAGIGLLYHWRMMPRIRVGPVAYGGDTHPDVNEGAWQRKLELEQDEQEEVDRILAKVSESGIQSLTRRERKTLEQATQRQRERDRRAGRVDRV